MAWICLLAAGIFEIGFTTFMKLSQGFTRWPYTVAFVASAVCSLYLLMVSLRTLPLGTAYAVWTGVGACGTAIVGILFFGESSQLLRVFFLMLIIISVIGLRYVEG